ncbi:hypothetical protein SJI00_22040 [Pseudomonas sp. RP23018S]|nr:hypothetical protein [Pseudomonas sp. RP23018S]
MLQKKDLYGAWHTHVDDAASNGMALLVLDPAGTATDVLMLKSQGTLEKIVQKSSWSYDAERNLFEQTVTEISTEKATSVAVVTHPHETIRASISLVKLGDDVIGIKFTKDNGEVMGYRKVGDAMREALLGK